jgi:hypothetical protein
MTRYNIKSLCIVALTVLTIAACKEDNTERSIVTSFEKFGFTTLPQHLVVSEADATHTFTFGFDDRQIMDVTIDIAPGSGSTATEHEDFDLSTHQVSVRALEKTGSFDITVHADQDPEGDETVVLTFAGHDPHGLPTPAETLVLTIRDSLYPVAVDLGWEGTFEYAGSTYTLCPNVDIDLFLLDDQGQFAGGFGGATAACPETMSTGPLGDGDYTIIANLYGNGLFGAPDIDTIPIPMEVVIYKGGVISSANSPVRYSTADFPQITLWTAYTPSDQNGDFLEAVGVLRVGGGKVALINPDGNEVGSYNK